ncbi:retropepsin-like aspartic protease family protein [Geomonas subterranea]|uniref:retropepsin-like aspartic protease family protein n=1 Tax=Geomonas subterranea TaxID=2847989 RepID=UPI001CD58F41|nr:retropepsin-like aspartic protease [Geomonas fuzhouensis]
MDLEHLCGGIKERVALELREITEGSTRQELLLAALTDVERVVFPALAQAEGRQEYRALQDAVLDLVSSIAIPLIKAGDRDAGAALAELAAACPDAMIRRKISGYALELSTQHEARERRCASPAKTAAGLAGLVAVAAVMFFLLWPYAAPEQVALAPAQRAAVEGEDRGEAQAGEVAPSQEWMGERREAQLSSREERTAGALTPPPNGEVVTKVRVVDNQVLVPVTIRHGGQAVRLELVLDTGATRTALHESVASRLPIDLRSAGNAQAELADGRVVRSKIVRVDAVVVGPHVHAPMEVELISYSGSAGMHDGLLGMDFLRRHRYQLDMEHESIRWF